MTILVPGVSACVSFSGKKPAVSELSPLPEQYDTLASEGNWLGAFKGDLHQTREGLLTAMSGRYYWRDREIADHATRNSSESTLAFAYRKFGEGLLRQLAGRFSLVVWDQQQRKGLVATDRFGQNTVYWHAGDEIISVAPTTHLALKLSGIKPEISKQAIYNYLFFHMVPSPGSIYQDINKLPAAHALRLSSTGAELFCYWQPEFSEHAEKRASVAGEEMLNLLRSSVSELQQGQRTGAFLSGGLDSSTVAGLLAQSQGDGAATFSIGFDAQGYDEIEYARIASRQFKTKAHEYYVTPEDVLDILPAVAEAYDEPFGNSSAIPAYFCAKLAKEHGMDCLLAGDGGDELFAGNERYAKQTIFENYRRLPKALRAYLLDPLSSRLPAKGLPGKFASYVKQANVPLPARLHTYNFLTRFGTEELFTQKFISDIDAEEPFTLENNIYHRPSDASRLNRMLYLDWQHTLADNDLRKVNRMCQLAGIDVEYPMLDDLVVELSTRIPSSRKMRFNRLRDFYKRAVKDFLPESIINKSKHGFGLPFGVWMSTHSGLQKLAHDCLAQFRQREIMNADFLDELMRLHDQSHAGYYGELVWILVMLELWLQQHEC